MGRPLCLAVIFATFIAVSAQGTSLVTTAQAPALTPCQQCCAPGGDCSKASHGQAGTCCGVVGGRSFCCPAFTTGAKCFACNNGYRCFMGRPSSNICVNDGGVKGRSPRMHHPIEFRESSSDPMVSFAVLLIIVAALFYVIHSCANQRHLHGGYAMQPAACAVGYPAHQCAVGGYPGGGYPCAGCESPAAYSSDRRPHSHTVPREPLSLTSRSSPQQMVEVATAWAQSPQARAHCLARFHSVLPRTSPPALAWANPQQRPLR